MIEFTDGLIPGVFYDDKLLCLILGISSLGLTSPKPFLLLLDYFGLFTGVDSLDISETLTDEGIVVEAILLSLN